MMACAFLQQKAQKQRLLGLGHDTRIGFKATSSEGIRDE